MTLTPVETTISEERIKKMGEVSKKMFALAMAEGLSPLEAVYTLECMCDIARTAFALSLITMKPPREGETVQ